MKFKKLAMLFPLVGGCLLPILAEETVEDRLNKAEAELAALKERINSDRHQEGALAASVGGWPECDSGQFIRRNASLKLIICFMGKDSGSSSRKISCIANVGRYF